MKSSELFKELQFLMAKPALLEAVEAVANYSGPLTTTASEIIRQAVMRVGNADAFKQNGQPFVFAAKFYNQTIAEILSEFDWRFARHQIGNVVKDNVNPVSGYAYRYALPAGALRILRVNGIDEDENFGSWEVVGGFVHTDLVSPVTIDYIAAPANDTSYPAIFIELVVARLAYKLALALGVGDPAIAASKEIEALLARPSLQREIETNAAPRNIGAVSTPSEICKLAIMRLGSPDTFKVTGAQPMVFANSFYEQTLEELLCDVPWAFARKHVSINADAANPSQGYAKRYALPADFGQLLRVNNVDTLENFGQWEIVGSFIHTDSVSPISVDYTAIVTSVPAFPPAFVECLVARIAAKIALPLTANAELAASMANVAAETMQRPSVRVLIEKSAKPRVTTSANTVAEICRQAILRVGSADLFKPFGEPMSLATSLFDQTRNELLADFDWQFARIQTSINADLVAPAFGYAKRYLLPTGTLKVLRVNGVDEDENFGKWEIVGNYLHTDFSPSVQIEATSIVTDASKFPPVFANMLTVTLAMKLAQLVEIQQAPAQ